MWNHSGGDGRPPVGTNPTPAGQVASRRVGGYNRRRAAPQSPPLQASSAHCVCRCVLATEHNWFKPIGGQGIRGVIERWNCRHEARRSVGRGFVAQFAAVLTRELPRGRQTAAHDRDRRNGRRRTGRTRAREPRHSTPARCLRSWSERTPRRLRCNRTAPSRRGRRLRCRSSTTARSCVLQLRVVAPNELARGHAGEFDARTPFSRPHRTRGRPARLGSKSQAPRSGAGSAATAGRTASGRGWFPRCGPSGGWWSSEATRRASVSGSVRNRQRAALLLMIASGLLISSPAPAASSARAVSFASRARSPRRSRPAQRRGVARRAGLRAAPRATPVAAAALGGHLQQVRDQRAPCAGSRPAPKAPAILPSSGFADAAHSSSIVASVSKSSFRSPAAVGAWLTPSDCPGVRLQRARQLRDREHADVCDDRCAPRRGAAQVAQRRRRPNSGNRQRVRERGGRWRFASNHASACTGEGVGLRVRVAQRFRPRRRRRPQRPQASASRGERSHREHASASARRVCSAKRRASELASSPAGGTVSILPARRKPAVAGRGEELHQRHPEIDAAASEAGQKSPVGGGAAGRAKRSRNASNAGSAPHGRGDRRGFWRGESGCPC